jgi:hypothetical protein
MISSGVPKTYRRNFSNQRSNEMKLFQKIKLGLVFALAMLAIPQIADATGAFTSYAQNKILDNILRGQSNAMPGTMYVALYTSCPTATTSGTEVSGGSYARVSYASTLANWAGTQGAGTTAASSGTGGTTSNNNTIGFTTSTGIWGTVNCWGLIDASTSGNLWIFGSITTPPTITSGMTASFAAGAATFQLQ